VNKKLKKYKVYKIMKIAIKLLTSINICRMETKMFKKKIICKIVINIIRL